MSADPLRVMVLPTRYPVLSETFVSLEIAELRRRDVHVDVVAYTVLDSDDGEVEWVFAEHSPLRLVQAHLAWLLRAPVRYARYVALWWLSRGEGEGAWRHLPWWASEIRRRRVDVLHAQFAWSSATRAWALSTLTGVPWVVTAHAHDIFASPHRLVEKLSAADAAVTVCDYNRDQLRLLGVARDIDLVVCGVADRGPATREPVPGLICTVARLVPKKGIDLLVAAVGVLRDRGVDVRLEIVGDGPEGPALRRQIDELGLPDRVTLVGPADHDAALAAMERAAVFALPARVAADGDRDSMPVVIKEAMALGRPVVATAVVAIPEMVDETTGWLVPPDDVEALADALGDAVARPDDARARGAAGRRRVLDQFLERDQAAILEGIFRRVRHSRSAP